MEVLLIVALCALLVGAMGCGEDCGSAGRFTDENGLTVLVVCGQTQFPTPTAGP